MLTVSFIGISQNEDFFVLNVQKETINHVCREEFQRIKTSEEILNKTPLLQPAPPPSLFLTGISSLPIRWKQSHKDRSHPAVWLEFLQMVSGTLEALLLADRSIKISSIKFSIKAESDLVLFPVGGLCVSFIPKWQIPQFKMESNCTPTERAKVERKLPGREESEKEGTGIEGLQIWLANAVYRKPWGLKNTNEIKAGFFGASLTPFLPLI